MRSGPQLLYAARAADDLPEWLVPDADGHHVSSAFAITLTRSASSIPSASSTPSSSFPTAAATGVHGWDGHVRQ